MKKIMKIKITQNPPPTHSTALRLSHKVMSILLLYREWSTIMPHSINVRSGSSTSVQCVSVTVYIVTKCTKRRDYHDLLSHSGIM